MIMLIRNTSNVICKTSHSIRSDQHMHTLRSALATRAYNRLFAASKFYMTVTNNKRTITQMTADTAVKSNNKIILQVKKLSENATTPTRGSAGAAGYDLSSAVDTVVPSKGKALVATDLSIALPTGVYGRVAPRSGLTHKNFIDVGAGVIDEDYRGPLGVILFNFSDVDFTIKKGDRIAQLILEKIAIAEVVEVEKLDETIRGVGGYGSTGVSAK